MSKDICHEIPLPPENVLEQLKKQTVAFESITSLSSPLESYGKFLQESFSGENTVVARITGERFRLLPIGIWPVKGKSALACVGAMHGNVRGCKAGSKLYARFKIAPIYIIYIIGMSLLSLLAVTAMSIVTLLGFRMEGFIMLWCVSGAMCAATLFLSFYVWFGRRNQAEILRKFVDNFVTGIKPGADRENGE